MRDARPPVVFAELIERLRSEGFVIGTSHYLRLQQLLPHVAELPPEQLRTVLGPLFARNAEEQARFYRAYDEFLAYQLSVPADGVVLAAQPLVRSSSSRRSARIWIWIAVAAVALLPLLIRIAQPPRERERDAATRGTVPIVVRSAREVPRPVLSMRTALERTRAFAAKHPFLSATAVVLLGGFLLELRRSIARMVSRHRHAGSGRPYAWPLRADDSPVEIFTSHAFDEAARLLRGREASGQQRLDLPRTIRASIRALGYIVPVYREGQRPPEYLLLIERRSARDQLAAYFDALADALERAGVLVERAYFESDPRRAAAVLRHRHPDHRLLLCASSPSVLLDPVTGEAGAGLDAAFPWQKRAILVAEGVMSATALRRPRFGVGEATAAGLRAVAESWQVPNERIQSTLVAMPPDPSLDDVRERLTPAANELLLRCAAHATLEWPLTCALLPRGAEAAETERVLLELSRLPWFRAGSIPPREREELVAGLNAREEAAAVREIVLRVLRESPPPSGSAAARAREVAALVQQLFIDRTSRARFRSAARRLRRYPLELVRADLPLLELLRTAPATRIWRRVPVWIRRLFFPSASPALGGRLFVGFVPLVLLAAVLFFAGGLTSRNPETAPAFGGGGGGGAGVSANLPPVQTETSVTELASTTAPDDASLATAGTGTQTLVETDAGTSGESPRIFRPEDLPIPAEAVPPPETETEATPSPLANTLPAPVLRMPAGRIDIAAGSAGPIDFAWNLYGSYDLVIWKDTPAGEPLFTTHVRGLRYTWRPDTLEPAATYYWTLRAPVVPSSLEPQSFVVNPVALENLLARDEADQIRRSHEVPQETIYHVPCSQTTRDTDTVSFGLGPNEVIVNARAEVVYRFMLDSARVSVRKPSGNSVTIDYDFTASLNVECKVQGAATVRVTATIGPRIR